MKTFTSVKTHFRRILSYGTKETILLPRGRRQSEPVIYREAKITDAVRKVSPVRYRYFKTCWLF